MARAIGVLPDGTPYYAPFGMLARSGDRVCCHLCGRWFLSVASHLRVHGWTKAGYLDAFGLERGNALRGEATRKRRAAALTARQVTEHRIVAAQQAARERARSGELAALAAEATRGRAHPPERRRKTLAALRRVDPRRQAAANTRRARAEVRACAKAIAAQHGFASFGDYVDERLGRGLSLAAISREAGQHKDWLARHVDLLVPGFDPAAHRAQMLDARWPMPPWQVPVFLRERHVQQGCSVAAIAAEVGLSRAAVRDALQRHHVPVTAYARVPSPASA